MSGAHPAPRTPEPRIGDAEREGAAWALGEHFASGRLSKDEYDERAGAAWKARTHSDLAPLFMDLPHPHGRPAPRPAWAATQPPPGPQARPRRRGSPWLAVLVALIVLTVLAEAPLMIVLIVAFVVFGKILPGCRR